MPFDFNDNLLKSRILVKTMKRIIATLCLVIPSLCFAGGDFFCTGTVETIGIHSPDKVILRLSGMNTSVVICNLNQTLGTVYPVSPQQCKAAYATLLLISTLRKQTTVWFDNTTTGTNCSNFAPWEMATARYVGNDQ